ncbi:MAG: Fur family transcriptional regulator [Lachnospiraceae bacterium]|jgi:Fe2+ or Zn2+ uptake regulation protein
MNRRNTIQRTIVLDTVNNLKSHATADEVYNEIKKIHPSISRATVYRNLNLLAEMGEIRRIELPGSADRFDHRPFDHCHIKCEKCGRLFDVDMDFVTGLDKNINDDRGFRFTGYDILFHGICPDCLKEK